MTYYLVESYFHRVEHGGRSSAGVLGEHKGREKIYLHVLPIADGELGALAPRVDEDGNKQHDRLALPRNEDWWVAVAGDVSWPRVVRPKMVSHCTDVALRPRPAPLSSDDLQSLRKSGVGDVPAG